MSLNGLRAQLAVLSLGFETMGMAAGTAAFQIFRPVTCGGSTHSTQPSVFPAYEASLGKLWKTAIERLNSQATAIGAHGVVGMTVDLRSTADGTGGTILQLSGTAIRVRRSGPLPRPFLTTLSMDGFLKLLLGGWVPCGIAWGFSAVHVHGWALETLRAGRTWRNVEYANATAGVQLARTRAEQQARQHLSTLGADGAAAMAVELKHYPQHCTGVSSLLVEGHVVGTAIARFGPPTAAIDPVRDLQRSG